MRVRSLLAVGSALLLFVGLAFVTVTLTSGPGKRPVPVQQTGTAAGRPHRVPAAATLGRMVNGRFVPDSSPAAGHLPGPVAEDLSSTRRVPGAVPPAVKPKPVKLPARGKAAMESPVVLKAPAPVHKTGYVAKTSKKLPLTSANQVTYANADGTKTAFRYEYPVSYRRPDGAWAAINSTLIPVGKTPSASPSASPSGSLSASPAVTQDAWFATPVAASPSSSPPGTVTPVPSPSMLPSATVPRSSPPASASSSSSPSASPSAPPASGWREQSEARPESFAAYANASDLVSVPVGSGQEVSFGISGAAPAAGDASGGTVDYADVRQDASVDFSAGTGMVKERIVLSSPSAPGTWIFPLDLKGLRAQMGPGGIVEFADTTGTVVAYVPHGYMSDSKIDPHSGDGATSYGVTYSLITVGGRQAIEMTLDTAWLESAQRVYPVTVDPSVKTEGNNGTTYVQYPYTNDYSGDAALHVGTWDGGSDKAKAFLAFGDVASGLKNDTVLGVRLSLYNTWSYSCSARPVYVYPVASSWSVTGSKSWPGPSTGGTVGSASFATGWTPSGSSSSPCPDSWEGITLNQAGVNLVNGWTHNSASDHGLAVGASTSDSYAWKQFASASSPTGNPFLAITYTTDGASYSLAAKQASPPVTPSQNGKFAIKVTNTGSSTWNANNGNGYEISYRAYNSKNQEVANHPVFTPMPSTVAPGQSVTVTVTVASLPAGSYALDFDMFSGANGSSPVSFSSQGIDPFVVGLTVDEPPPTVSEVYPPTGYVSSTLRQQLSTTATGSGTLSYDFTLTCEPVAGQTCTDSSVTSGSIATPYWTPPAADLDWNIQYQWTVVVTATSNGVQNSTPVGPVAIGAQVPQPAITSGLGGGSGQAYDPLSGNYTTSATDAAVKAVGPPLEIDRTYNSLDPRTTEAFGAGWSTVADTSLRDDTSTDGTVTVTMPSGQQLRFGQNGDGSYAPPFGSVDALVKDSSGDWTLRDSSGDRYAFTAATGQLSSITEPIGYAQDFTYNSDNQLATITDAISGRTLSLTWETPSGTLNQHVVSVSTQAPSSGASPFTWTYTYAGDELSEACAPASVGTGCTQYSYGTGSHYLAGVLDANPRGYWQLGDADGTDATDEVDANLGTADGVYSNVTLGQAGPLAGSSETAASFDGTSSYVSLPDDLISDGTDVSVGLWFNAAPGSNGVLFSYDADAITNSSGSSAPRHPLLYIGTNGDLYGEYWNGSIAPLHTTASVADGNWHYAVISAASDSQTLYLDGDPVGTLSGQINQQAAAVDTIGAGFWNSWPSVTSAAASYFGGDIAQVAVYPYTLPAAAVQSQYALKRAASPELTQITLPSGKISEAAAYDSASGRLTTYTDPHGGQWAIGQPLATGNPPTADSIGQVIDTVQVTDPGGGQANYSYDMLDGGRLAGYDNGVDPPEAYGYDAAGFLTTIVDQDGNLACLTNDVHGNVLARTWYPVEPATLPGIGTGASPSPCAGAASSSPDCTTSGAPCTTFYSYSYNAANPLDPDNGKLLTVRDGRSASATDNTYETTYSYTTYGQLKTSTTPATTDFPSGRTTVYGYTVGTEAAAGGGTEPAGLLSSVLTPGGATTSYSYYSNGDLAQVTEPSGRYTTYAYDALGRPTASTVHTSTYPAGETTSYTYTPTGQPATVIYPPVTNAVTSVSHQLEDTYSYDDDNDLLSLTQDDLAGGDPSRTASYTYNHQDEVATVTQPAGATTGGTSQTGGASSTDPEGATTGYDYDAFGNVIQRTDSNGNQYRFGYNEYQEPVQETLYTSSQNEADSVATCTAPATQDADGGCDLVLDSYAYDPAGLLAASTGAMGRTTSNTYDDDQELLSTEITQACSSSAPCTSMGPCTPTAQCTTGSVGTQAAYTYDGAGNLVSKAVSAMSGGGVTATTTVNYTIDAADRMTAEVDDATPAGGNPSGYANRTTAWTYDAVGDVLSKTLGTGGTAEVTDYGYDTAGDQTSQTVQDSAGNLETSWTYDQNGLPLSMTTPRGNASGATASDYTTSYAYGSAGNLVTQTGPPVAVSTFASQTPATTRPVTTYGYDTFGDQTQERDPNLNVTMTGYDGDGRVTSITQPAYTPPGGSSSITQPTSYTYDEDGNLASVTDPAGNATSYGYDALGDVTSVMQPLLPGQSQQGTWQYTYDADGERLSATDPLNHESQQTFDYFGNVATSTDPAQNTTSYAYDYLGDQTMTDTPDGSVTKSTYDHLGEVASVADAYQDTGTYDYDGQGNLAHAYNPDGSSEQYGYDQAGRLTSATDYPAPAQGTSPLRSESFGYDADGNQASVDDWNGNTTAYSHDAAGNLTSQVVPVSSTKSITTSYGYDAAGNQTSVTDGNQNTTWTTYNPWNLSESVIEPTIAAAPSTADTTWTTAYDTDGHPATVTQPGGISLTYGYDPLSDITSETGSGGSASTPNRSYTYDLDGRMQTASAPGGTDTFTYYPTGNLDTASGPSGNSSYQYNNDGLVSSETDSAGTTGYTYDSADRLATETDPLTGSTMTWAYNADSDPKSVSYAENGTAGPVETFGYDGLERLKTDTLTSAPGTLMASESYGYDDNGNLESQIDGGLLPASSVTYGYDEANRLTSATANGSTLTYGYDDDGNLTTSGPVTTTFNAQDQPMSSADGSGTTGYSYSLNGDLSSVTPPSGSAQDFTWDAFGELASGPGIGYAYDALGRPVVRTIGTLGQTDMSYLGASGTVAADGIYGGSYEYSYTPSGQMTGTQLIGGNAFATMSDAHGDLSATFAPSPTEYGLAGYTAYSPYGQQSQAGFHPVIGFQGDYTETSTGLVDMGARWYDPATGSFASGDTINGVPVPSTVDGNPYAYADDNPLTGTDPTGHFCASCVFKTTVRGGEDLAEAALRGIGQGTEAVGGAAETAAGWGTAAASSAVAGFTGLFTALLWAFPEHTASGCGVDVICGGGGGGDDFPHPTWPKSQLPSSSTGSSSSSSSAGGGPCSVDCFSPPPPPPPQDCYTAGTCVPPNPPDSLKREPVITHVVHDITNFNQACAINCIIEHANPADTSNVKGLSPSASITGSNSTSGSGSDLPRLLLPIGEQGVQPSPGGGSNIGGNGSGGNNRTGNGDACEEPPGGQNSQGSSAAESGTISARAVRFSQDSISRMFKGGKGSVLQMAQDFASGALSPDALPPIRLFKQGGNLYSLDNRRLFAGQMADVDLPYRMATQAEINRELGDKFTTENGGTGIIMRGVGYFSWCEQ